MDSTKRMWIYTGLAIAAGVGLVSAMSKNDGSSLPPAGPGGSGNGNGGGGSSGGGGGTGPVPPPISTQTVFPALRTSDRILLVGDSLAQGLTAPMKQLAADFGSANFVGDGRQSTRINQWSSQPWLSNDLQSAMPTLTLVSLGTNDMKLTDPSTETQALQTLVQALQASGGTVVWIAPPTMQFPDRGVRQMIDSTGLPVFHSESLTIPRGSDQIHPTTAGYAGWAGSIWQYLLQGGGQRVMALNGFSRPSFQTRKFRVVRRKVIR